MTLTIPQLRDRWAELLDARTRLKARIATERPLDWRVVRLHMHACREVADARRELDERLALPERKS